MANFLRWIRKLPFASRRQLMGTDFEGNSYYEVPGAEGGRPRRMVYSKLDEMTFDSGNIPIQWNAWLRYTRKDPPTLDELKQAEENRELMRQRVLEIERREAEGKALPGARPALDHAAAKLFREPPKQATPQTIGTTFAPGAWLPGQPAAQPAPAQPPAGQDQPPAAANKEKEEPFKPEEWKP